MKNAKEEEEKATKETTDFFEKFGVGEHLDHPSFAMDDCDFEGMVD
ncbi:MAG: hypothetical protein OES15_07630 [Nitrosopumilus sp.]|nr:hypothetical protein [Nitrosopumilus sp.]MDH3853622.1 hypothetical protein [Nitrosopumilus sp.]